MFSVLRTFFKTTKSLDENCRRFSQKKLLDDNPKMCRICQIAALLSLENGTVDVMNVCELLKLVAASSDIPPQYVEICIKQFDTRAEAMKRIIPEYNPGAAVETTASGGGGIVIGATVEYTPAGKIATSWLARISGKTVKFGVSFVPWLKPYAEPLGNATQVVVEHTAAPVCGVVTSVAVNPVLRMTTNIANGVASFFVSSSQLKEAEQLKKCVAEARSVLVQRKEKERQDLGGQLRA